MSPVKVLFASETSWRRLQDMSSRRLQDVFSVTIFRLPRRLPDVFKTSSKRLGRRKIVTLKTCWRRLQDMSWRPINVCWERFRWKSTEELCLITLKSVQSLKKYWLFVPKMTWDIWWILMWAVASLHFDVLLFSIAHKVSVEKLQKNCFSWHWKKFQTLKKNWLFVWKMTWEIWRTLIQAVESLKICTLMGYFCRKYVMFELRKYRGVVSWKMIMVSKMA